MKDSLKKRVMKPLLASQHTDKLCPLTDHYAYDHPLASSSAPAYSMFSTRDTRLDQISQSQLTQNSIDFSGNFAWVRTVDFGQRKWRPLISTQNYVCCTRWCRKTTGEGKKKNLPVWEPNAPNALQFLPAIGPAVHPLCPGFPPPGRSPRIAGGGCGCGSVPCAGRCPPCARRLREAAGSAPACSPAPAPWVTPASARSQPLSFFLLLRAHWLQPLLVVPLKWRRRSSPRLLTATYWIIVEYMCMSVCIQAVIFWLSQQI